MVVPRVSFAGLAGLIAVLFALHDFLCDKGIGPVRLNEKNPNARRVRPVADHNRCRPEKYAIHSAGVPRKAAKIRRKDAIRKAMVHLNLERPQHNVSRNSLLR